MAFPTLPVLDDFNRGNSATLGSDWTADIAGASYVSLGITSNQAAYNGTNGFQSNWWNRQSFAQDQEVYADIPTKGTTNVFRLYARLTAVGTTTYGGYELEISGTTANSFLSNVVAGVRTTILTTGVGFASGDSAGLSCVGNTITAYRKPSAGSWGSIGTVQDSAGGGGGFIGLWVQNDIAWVLDNFGGGSIQTSLTLGELGTGRI